MPWEGLLLAFRVMNIIVFQWHQVPVVGARYARTQQVNSCSLGLYFFKNYGVAVFISVCGTSFLSSCLESLTVPCRMLY